MLQKFSEISGSGIPVIISSDGDYFSQGYDCSCKLVRDNEFVQNFVSLGTAVMQLIRNHNAPVLLYGKGHVWGAALELALICDAFVCSDTCDIAYPDASFGLPPIFLDPFTFREILGERLFARILSGTIMHADEGLESNIITAKGSYEDAIGVMNKLNNPTFITGKEWDSIDLARIRNHLKYIQHMDTSKINLKALESYRKSNL